MAPVARNESSKKSFVRNLAMSKPPNVSMSYEDTLREMEAFLDGKLDKHQICQDACVDVTETPSSSAIKVPEASDPDATEYSSSFGDTNSRNENTSVTSDVEVESEFRADNELGSLFDSFGTSAFPTRKTKLTVQWRNYIRPLMWRCKWTELKIKELESQALKYTRELEKIDQTKMSEQQLNAPDVCSKSLPYPGHPVKSRTMKRIKRKRVEDVTDISSYMSIHNIFSYFESKEPDADNAVVAEESKKVSEPDTKNDDFSLDDNWSKHDEDSLDQILRHIGTIHSQVHRLKSHLENVLFKDRVMFSSTENLCLLPYEGQTSASQSPNFSPANSDTISLDDIYAPTNLSDYDIGDLVLPESTISDYAAVTQFPDMIESSVRLLPAVDVTNLTVHQPQIVESAENISDETPMHINVDENLSHKVTDHSTSVTDQIVSDQTTLTPDPVAEDGMPLEKSTLTCITSEGPSKNKRKRGERKAAPGGWNLKCSGEPDSN